VLLILAGIYILMKYFKNNHDDPDHE